MMGRRRDLLAALLLAALPAAAYAPALAEGRLLAPGDGAALHFPLQAAAWASWRQGELPSWNPGTFLGAPLLASYRAGALFPPLVLLSGLPAFGAFQALMLLSLAGAGVATFFYLRALGAERVGAYVAGLGFALGPYLVGHLGDSATVRAAPFLPLGLWSLEAVLARPRAIRAAGTAAAVAMLVLAGSPEATRAGAVLLGGRLLVALVQGYRQGVAVGVAAVSAGALLAAPQLLPALIAARDAGRSITGLAGSADTMPAGFTGLILRYASHTPAGALALASVPLLGRATPVRALAAALLVVLGLQWGQGPLAAPGALPLTFDLMLATLAGLSLSAQWRARREPEGRRLRAWFLVACLGQAAALSVAAAALGPLPQTLAGAVGVLALGLILYFPQASSASPVKAGIWLLPLTVSFLLQPHGRRAWEGAPTAALLHEGTTTRQAIDREMAGRRGERSLALVFEWPREAAHDLAYGNLAALAGRTSANGYDPLVPFRTRAALGGMSVGGVLPDSFAQGRPQRLELLGIRWVQLPAAALLDARGGDDLRLTLESEQPRFFPVPATVATHVRLASCVRGGRPQAPGAIVAWMDVRLATGRSFELPVRAGLETGDAAPGECREADMALPARYRVDALGLRLAVQRPRLLVWSLALRDSLQSRAQPVVRAAAYVSDRGHFREVAATPLVRLFELPNTLGPARVVPRLRPLPDDEKVLAALELPDELGLDPEQEAVGLAADLEGIVLPADARSRRAELLSARGSRLEVRAEGPGALVVTTAFDAGWRVSIDGRDSPLFRVNHVQMATVLPAGRHRVVFRHRPRGFSAGLALSALTAVALFAAWARQPRSRSDQSGPLPPYEGEGQGGGVIIDPARTRVLACRFHAPFPARATMP